MRSGRLIYRKMSELWVRVVKFRFENVFRTSSSNMLDVNRTIVKACDVYTLQSRLATIVHSMKIRTGRWSIAKPRQSSQKEDDGEGLRTL